MNTALQNYLKSYFDWVRLKEVFGNFSPDFKFLVYFIGLSFFLLSVFGSFGLFNAGFWTRITLSFTYSLVSFLVFGISLSAIKMLSHQWKPIYWFPWLLVGLSITSPLNLYFHDRVFGEEKWTMLRLFTIGYYLLLLFVVSLCSYILIFKRSKSRDGHHKENLKLKILADNPKNNFVLPVDDFLFARSAGNYVEVHYVHKNTLCTKLIRSTIKRVAKQSESYANVMQCHQAFVINLDKANKLIGNAQSRNLTLKGYSDSIPVSRRFAPEIREALHQISLNLT